MHSIRLSIQKKNLKFSTLLLKCLQMLNWYLVCESTLMSCRSSLHFKFTFRSTSLMFVWVTALELSTLFFILTLADNELIFCYVSLPWWFMFEFRFRSTSLIFVWVMALEFTEIQIFCTFFLNAWRYWVDFWYVSLPWWVTDQVNNSFRFADFFQRYQLPIFMPFHQFVSYTWWS